MTLAQGAERLSAQCGRKITKNALHMAITRGALQAELVGSVVYVVTEEEIDRYGRERLGKRIKPKKEDGRPKKVNES